MPRLSHGDFMQKFPFCSLGSFYEASELFFKKGGSGFPKNRFGWAGRDLERRRYAIVILHITAFLVSDLCLLLVLGEKQKTSIEQ